MIFKTIVLLTIIAISGAIQPESIEDDDGPESFDRYKAVEHFSNKDHYSSYKDYDKHKKKDYYDKKNKYYEEGKPYKKQKYYKDVNEKPYKEKNYKKHWEDKEFSKNNENEYRRNTNYMDFNEIDSNDFQKNKFSKYDKHTKHPNHFEDTRKNVDIDQHDKYEKNEKYHEPEKYQKNEKYYEPEKYQKTEKYYEPEKYQKTEKFYEPEKYQKTEKYYEPEKYQKTEKYYEPEKYQKTEKYYEHDKKHKGKLYAEYKDHPKQKYDLTSDTDVNYLRHIPSNPDSEYVEVKNPGKHEKTKEYFEPNYQNENEMPLKRVKKDFYKDLKILDLSKPPPTNETVLMARYIIHNVDWAALATVSARSPTKGTPFANIKSVSDGPVNKGSGVPFFYLTPRDLSSQDLNKDNRCTVTVTLAETSYCQSENFDPEDPRCARLILTGKIKRIKEGTPEEDFAKEALFSRHPAMSKWPEDHEWFFAKLKIGQIVLLDQFGGPKYIDVQEYLNVEPPKQT